MRKFTLTILTVCLLALMTACGREDASGENKADTKTEKEDKKENNKKESKDADSDQLYFEMPDVIVNGVTYTPGKTTYADLKGYLDERRFYPGVEKYNRDTDGHEMVALQYSVFRSDGIKFWPYFASFGAIPKYTDLKSVTRRYINDHYEEYKAPTNDFDKLEVPEFIADNTELAEEEIVSYLDGYAKKEFDKGSSSISITTQIEENYSKLLYDPSHFVFAGFSLHSKDESSDEVSLSNGFKPGTNEQEVLDYYGYTDDYKMSLDKDTNRKNGFMLYTNEDYKHSLEYAAPEGEYYIRYDFDGDKVDSISFVYNDWGEPWDENIPSINYLETDDEIAKEQEFLRDGHLGDVYADGDIVPYDYFPDDEVMDMESYVIVNGYCIILGEKTPTDRTLAHLTSQGEWSELPAFESKVDKYYRVDSYEDPISDIMSVTSFLHDLKPYVSAFHYGYRLDVVPDPALRDVHIELPRGISDTSTAQEALDAYGEPDYYYTDSNGGLLWYCWTSNNHNFLRLAFNGLDPNTSVVSDIYMAKHVNDRIRNEAIGFMVLNKNK